MALTTVNYRMSSRCSDNMETTTITIHEKSTEQKLLNNAPFQSIEIGLEE